MIETDVEYEVKQTETSIQTVYCDGCQDSIPEMNAADGKKGLAHYCGACSTTGEPLVGVKTTHISSRLSEVLDRARTVNDQLESIRALIALLTAISLILVFLMGLAGALSFYYGAGLGPLGVVIPTIGIVSLTVGLLALVNKVGELAVDLERI